MSILMILKNPPWFKMNYHPKHINFALFRSQRRRHQPKRKSKISAFFAR